MLSMYWLAIAGLILLPILIGIMIGESIAKNSSRH